MSSILKALKKLEDEFTRSGEKISLPKKLGTKRNIRRWEITSGRFTPLLWIFLGVIVIAVVGWIFIYLQQPADREATITAAPPEPVPVASKKVATPDSAIKPHRPVNVPPRQVATSQPVRPAEKTTIKRKASRPLVKTSKKYSSRKPVPLSQRQSAVNANAIPNPNAGIPVLESGPKLQAISWSKEPKDRIAVVNGNIVREGNTIDGYSITRIDKDEVVVRKGLDEWKLVF